MVYERNPNYRDADKVFFDKVDIKGGGDATSAARAVCETGEVDYAWNLQVQKAVLEPILAGGKCDAVAGGSFGVERIDINFANPDPALGDKRSEPDQPHPFLTDLKVRQAIAKAIDRQAIADQLYGPTGSPTCNIAGGACQHQLAQHHVRARRRRRQEAAWTTPAGPTPTATAPWTRTASRAGAFLPDLDQPAAPGRAGHHQANLAEIGIQR